MAAGEPTIAVRRHQPVFIKQTAHLRSRPGYRRSVDRYRHTVLHQIATGAALRGSIRDSGAPLPGSVCGAVTR